MISLQIIQLVSPPLPVTAAFIFSTLTASAAEIPCGGGGGRGGNPWVILHIGSKANCGNRYLEALQELATSISTTLYTVDH